MRQSTFRGEKVFLGLLVFFVALVCPFFASAQYYEGEEEYEDCWADPMYDDSAGLTIYFYGEDSYADYGIEEYYWTFGDGNSSYSMNPVHTYGSSGTYEVCLEIYSGYDCTDSVCGLITVSGGGESGLCEAVDNCSLVFTTGGNAPWYEDYSSSVYGGSSARSGLVSDNQQSWIQTTVEGPGTLRFHWQVSSESGYDFLEFYQNDALQERISGSVDWREKMVNISSGTTVLRWRYVKDVSLSVGSDAGWVDRIQWSPGSYEGEYESEGEENCYPDEIPPYIELQGGSYISWQVGVPYTDPGYSATDNCDGNLTSAVTVDGNVDSSTLGLYTLTYTVTDNAGNVASVLRRVQVVTVVVDGEMGYLRGDVNGDGIIDFDDILAALRVDSSSLAPNDPQMLRSDINGDGRIDSDDAYEIMIYVNNGGLITEAAADLRAESGANQVTLNWEPVAHPNLYGYAVYRRTGDGQFARIGATLDTSFTDMSVTTAEYEYYVRTVDVFQNLGRNSATVTVEANTVRIWVPEVRGAKGDLVRVPINFGSVRGIVPKAMYFAIGFDTSALEFDRIEKTVLSANLDFSTKLDPGLVRVISIDPNAQIVSGEGRFFDLYFRIRSNASNGCSDLTIDDALLKDRNDVEIRTRRIPGSLCVGPPEKPGDVNADGNVTDADAQMILDLWTRKVAPQTDYHLRVGDINGDGRLDSADATLILRMARGDNINPSAGKQGSAGFDSGSREIYLGDSQIARERVLVLPVTISNLYRVAGLDLIVTWPGDDFEFEGADKLEAVSDYDLKFNSGVNSARISLSSPTGFQRMGQYVILNLRFRAVGEETDSMKPPSVIAINYAEIKGEYGESFRWYDGTISRRNARITITKAGDYDEITLEAAARRLLDNFDAADINSDRLIDWTEARAYVPEMTRAQFDALDANSDGYLSRAELEAVVGGCRGCAGCFAASSSDTAKILMGDWLLLGFAIIGLLSTRKVFAAHRK